MIYLVIRKSDDPSQPGTVFQAHRDHPGDVYGPSFEVKPWTGPVPPIHCVDDPDTEPVVSYDPTFDNPEYTAFVATRVDFDNLADRADDEIDWLTDAITQIDDMAIEQLRGVLKRLARQNRFQIRAWRYIFKRMDRREQ